MYFTAQCITYLHYLPALLLVSSIGQLASIHTEHNAVQYQQISFCTLDSGFIVGKTGTECRCWWRLACRIALVEGWGFSVLCLCFMLAVRGRQG